MKPAAPTGWYIQTAGRVWGPYPATRMAAFAEEGRIAPTTPAGTHPAGPFAPAAHQAGLLGHFPPHWVSSTPRRGLFIWADAGDGLDALEASVGAHGPFLAIGPGLWLLLAREGATAVRNDLSRRLSGGRLIVAEAGLDEVAWFNLGGETDRLLRQLLGEAVRDR